MPPGPGLEGLALVLKLRAGDHQGLLRLWKDTGTSILPCLPCETSFLLHLLTLGFFWRLQLGTACNREFWQR